MNTADELPPAPRSDHPSKAESSASLQGGGILHSEPTLPEQFGRYRIIEQLGRGAMGTVYLARDSQLDRPVALKVPRFAQEADAGVLERFRREGRAAATLEHPNVCPVYDVGEIEGVHYLAMAYVEGQPLSMLIKDRHPLPQRAVADLVYKLALALAEAHARGVVHRDLKPANIMVNQRHEPVIMDFGLARREGTADARLTAEGAVLGTPAYMAPEQVAGDGDRIGPACDIYGLGVILYELLTGRLPYEGSVGEVLGNISMQPFPPPSQHRGDVDPALEAICLKAMSKRIEDRYATMGEFAAALTEYQQTSPASQAAVGRPSGPVGPAVPSATVPDTDRATDLLEKLVARLDASGVAAGRDKRRPWWQWTAAVGAAALLLIAVIFLANGKDVPPPGPVLVHIDVSIWRNDETVVFLLDGEPVNRGTLTEPVALEPGAHELVVKRGDEIIHTQRFTADADEWQVKVDAPAADKLAGCWRMQDGSILRLTRSADGYDVQVVLPVTLPYSIGELFGHIALETGQNYRVEYQWRESRDKQPESRRLTATLDGNKFRFEEETWVRSDVDLSAGDFIVRQPSSTSEIVIAPLTRQEFPQILEAHVYGPSGRVNSTQNLGKPMLVPPGVYDIRCIPAEGGHGSSPLILLRGVEVTENESVTIRTDRIITGVTVKPIGDITPMAFYVRPHTGDAYTYNKFAVITHTLHESRCSGFDRVMLASAGDTWEVLMDIDEESPLLVIASNLRPKPGELLEVDLSIAARPAPAEEPDDVTAEVAELPVELLGCWRTPDGTIVQLNGAGEAQLVLLSDDFAARGYAIGERFGRFTSTGSTLRFDYRWRESNNQEPADMRLTATAEDGTIQFEEEAWQRAGFELKVDEIITRQPSSYSSIIVEPLSRGEFPQIQWVEATDPNVANGTETLGKRMLVPAGLYDIRITPLEGGRGDSSLTLVRGVQVGDYETVTVHLNRLITGVMVKPIEDVTPNGFYITRVGGRGKFVVITHSSHYARCDGFDKVMVVPAGLPFDVLMDVEEEDQFVPVAESVMPIPAELLVIDPQNQPSRDE